MNESEGDLCIRNRLYLSPGGGGEEKDFDCAPKGVKREGVWGWIRWKKHAIFSPHPPPLDTAFFPPFIPTENHVIHQNSSIIPPTPQEINDVWALGLKRVAKLLII